MFDGHLFYLNTLEFSLSPGSIRLENCVHVNTATADSILLVLVSNVALCFRRATRKEEK